MKITLYLKIHALQVDLGGSTIGFCVHHSYLPEGFGELYQFYILKLQYVLPASNDILFINFESPCPSGGFGYFTKNIFRCNTHTYLRVSENCISSTFCQLLWKFLSLCFMFTDIYIFEASVIDRGIIWTPTIHVCPLEGSDAIFCHLGWGKKRSSIEVYDGKLLTRLSLMPWIGSCSGNGFCGETSLFCVLTFDASARQCSCFVQQKVTTNTNFIKKRSLVNSNF